LKRSRGQAKLKKSLTPSSFVALFNVLVQWQGWKADDTGFVALSIAEFSL
jgi:hypothetical protein